MSRGCKFFVFLLFLLDVILINISFSGAVLIRLAGAVSLKYELLWIYLNIVTLLTFLGMGMYDQKNGLPREEIIKTFKGITISLLLVFSSVMYVYYKTYFSRKVFLYYWFFAFSSLSIGRYLFKKFEYYLLSRGIGVKRVIIIGADSLGEQVREKIEREKLLGYQFVGFVDDNITGDNILGKLKALKILLKQNVADQVFLTIAERPKRRELYITLLCKKYGTGLSMVSPIFEILNKTDMNNKFLGIPTVQMIPSPLHSIKRLAKRSIDIVFALSVMIILSPIWILIAILIKIDSHGPVFYKQMRVGRDGKPFLLYKFRSMYDNADSQLEELRQFNETNGPIFKMVRDPRITRVGRWLRKLSIDEFPQFINVLNGDMSVVGPRPPIPAEVAKYDEWHKRRLEIDQGITGLWQISGRSKLSFEEMVLLDILYIENWSLWLDINIMLKTIPTILRTEGAY